MNLESIGVAEKLREEFEEELVEEIGEPDDGESLKEELESAGSVTQAKFYAKINVRGVETKLKNINQEIESLKTSRYEEIIKKHEGKDDEDESKLNDHKIICECLERAIKLINDDKIKRRFHSTNPKEPETDQLDRKQLISDLSVSAKKLGDIKYRLADGPYSKGQKYEKHRELIKAVEEDRMKLLKKIPEIDSALRNAEAQLNKLDEE